MGKIIQHTQVHGRCDVLIPTANMLAKIVEGIDNLPLDDRDVQGDLYSIYSRNYQRHSTNGQFRT